MFDKVYTRSLRPYTALLVLLLVTGCSKSFVVTSEVPQPLIERMPLRAHMIYSDEFKDYVYVEKGNDRALERVDFGSAQVGLFDRVMGDLLTLVDDPENTDLKIEPQILDFQYSVPSETKINMYEIWLKYRLRITDNQDAEVADWVVKGYGKTPTSMLSSHLKAFNMASNVALRDIGAQLALGFRTQPSIEDYLASRSANRSAGQSMNDATQLAKVGNNTSVAADDAPPVEDLRDGESQIAESDITDQSPQPSVEDGEESQEENNND